MTGQSYIDKHPHEKEAIDTILAIKDEFVNRIPEDIFVSRYLPMLTSQEEAGTNLQEWLSIAGHVYAEVIVEKDGVELFRVPPVFRRFQTKEHKYAYQSVDEIIKTAKLHSINSPIMGERVLEEGLRQTLPDTILVSDDDARWAAILKRYNIVMVNGVKEESKEKVVVDDVIDFDGYDPA